MAINLGSAVRFRDVLNAWGEKRFPAVVEIDGVIFALSGPPYYRCPHGFIFAGYDPCKDG